MVVQSQLLSSDKPSRRWIILILAGSLFILSQFYRSSVAVIAPNLVADLKLDAWELSTVSASFFYAFALMQVPLGMFLDTIGPRITMTALTLISVAGAFLFATGNIILLMSIGMIIGSPISGHLSDQILILGAVFLQGLGSLMKFLYPGTSLGPGTFRGAFIFCSVCLTLIGIFYTLTSETMVKEKE